MQALGSFIRSQRKLAKLAGAAVETAIRADQRLSDEQKTALVAVYHSMLRS